jgi:hypothetical protein
VDRLVDDFDVDFGVVDVDFGRVVDFDRVVDGFFEVVVVDVFGIVVDIFEVVDEDVGVGVVTFAVSIN